MRIFIFVLAVMLALPALGQRSKKSGDDVAPVFVEGIAYALPRTGLRLKVKAIKETFEPGPYAPYAEQLLGVSDARNRSSVRWMIDEVKLETFSEPDPEQVHKALGDAAFLVSLTPDGCLAGINAGNLQMTGMPVQANSFVESNQKEDGFSFSNFNDTPIYTPGDSTNNFRPVRVSTDVKAAEAAKRILECRLARFHMAAGLMDEFHPDGLAYQVSLKELEQIEKDYLSLFVGRTTYQEEKFSFDFVPASSSAKGDVVFRFSEDKGVLPASDLSGKPVMVRTEPEKDLISGYSGLAASENPNAGESGIYYRMPAVADVSVIFELKTIVTARTVLPQFGQVAPIPEELLFGGYSITIHPETGAVKSVTKK